MGFEGRDSFVRREECKAAWESEVEFAEMARVLRPGGLLFFHTFNRSWLAWLVVIKGVEWFVRNTPKDMHVLHLFLKPSEVEAMCREHEVELRLDVPGFAPDEIEPL